LPALDIAQPGWGSQPQRAARLPAWIVFILWVFACLQFRLAVDQIIWS
jgi:hypothetical protein